MGMMDDAWRDSVRDKKVKEEEKIFDDLYLAEVKVELEHLMVILPL